MAAGTTDECQEPGELQAPSVHASRSAGSQTGAPSTLAGLRPGRDRHTGRGDDRRKDMRRKEMGDMGDGRLSPNATVPILDASG